MRCELRGGRAGKLLGDHCAAVPGLGPGLGAGAGAGAGVPGPPRA